MKRMTVQAELDPTKCVGCNTCTHVCPTFAIRPNPVRPLPRTKTPPCSANCQAGNDVEGFVSLIRQGRFEDALALLHETNPFPALTGRVCFHPCQENCNRKEYDEGLSISSLERYISTFETKLQPLPTASRRQEKVAILGSGPAGLSCAYYLLQKGYNVTVFESKPLLGGWLRYGIPEYRLPRKVLDQEISKLKDLGLETKTGFTVATETLLEWLEKFDAIFLAPGRHQDVRLNIPGEEAENVISGGEFLKRFHSGETQAPGKRVAVIGGGNTAVDAARVLLRIGAKPFLLYRRSREEMPAFKNEVQEMEAEGVEVLFLAAPVRFILENGKVKSLECLRMDLGELERDGRRRPIPIPESAFLLAADAIIIATGETADLSWLTNDVGMEKNKIKIDLFCRTNQKKIFAGGDASSDTATVPTAIRLGRIASQGIDAYLNGQEMTAAAKLEKVEFAQMNSDYLDPQRQIPLPRLPLDARIRGFQEIRGGYDEAMAREEAGRCLGCASLPLYRPEDCRGCSTCEQRCPAAAISMKAIEKPFIISVDVAQSDPKMIRELCQMAHLNPKSVICICSSTRAEEVAAAILQGAKTPEEVSLKTGARTGCSVNCIQPIFRLLEAARIQIPSPSVADVRYRVTAKIWDIPYEVKHRYDQSGARFDEDIEFYKKLTQG